MVPIPDLMLISGFEISVEKTKYRSVSDEPIFFLSETVTLILENKVFDRRPIGSGGSNDFVRL